MKTKKKQELDYEKEEFTPSFYIIALFTIIGMLTVLLIFIGLIIAITKLLTGTL
jgi:hypothetical protein